MPKLKVQWDRIFIFRHQFKDLISQRNRLYKPGILQWQKEITTLSVIVLKAGILFFNRALKNAKIVISWTLIELTIIPKHQLWTKWEITAWMLTSRKRGREQIPIWIWEPHENPTVIFCNSKLYSYISFFTVSAHKASQIGLTTSILLAPDWQNQMQHTPEGMDASLF